MTVAIRNDTNAIAELKVPPPHDLGLGNISVNNCKNATFGTKVDCHGNLIVNQYLNVGDPKSEQYDLKNGIINGLIVTDSVVKADWKQKFLKLKYIWGSLILAVVATAVFCVVFLPQPQEKNDSEDVDLPYNYTLRLRTRPEWSLPKSETECKNQSIPPAKFVIVAHSAATNCFDKMNCAKVVKSLQNDHMKRDNCDIVYNFVIAGDGFIYEGRGWGTYGAHTSRFNCDSIGVAFLGNYDLQHLTPKMEEAFHLLIEEGLKLNEISREYKIFGQSQVIATKSPGRSVVEQMKKWKGWSEAKKEDAVCDSQNK